MKILPALGMRQMSDVTSLQMSSTRFYKFLLDLFAAVIYEKRLMSY